MNLLHLPFYWNHGRRYGSKMSVYNHLVNFSLFYNSILPPTWSLCHGRKCLFTAWVLTIMESVYSYRINVIANSQSIKYNICSHTIKKSEEKSIMKLVCLSPRQTSWFYLGMLFWAGLSWFRNWTFQFGFYVGPGYHVFYSRERWSVSKSHSVMNLGFGF